MSGVEVIMVGNSNFIFEKCTLILLSLILIERNHNSIYLSSRLTLITVSGVEVIMVGNNNFIFAKHTLILLSYFI
jgi:hypothetical protein